MKRLRAIVLIAIGVTCLGGLYPLGAAPVEFYSVLDGAPLAIKPQAHEIETEAVKAFKATGRNPYRAQPTAIAGGKALYEANCQTCHGPNATGKTGPSLVAEEYTYSRVATDVGMFEVIYGGASGVMPSWSKRGMMQDEMLQVMAFVRSLKRE